MKEPNTELSIDNRLKNIEAMLVRLVERETIREWYTTAELARIIGKAEFTVREYCRLARLRSERRQSGRGSHRLYVVSHSEVLRFQREGLLPARR